MINPPPGALQRRASELHASAKREEVSDADTAALLMFYAAECGLKAVYMRRNNLKSTSEARGKAKPAREFGHSLRRLLAELSVPAATISPPPACRLVRSGESVEIPQLHEALRYGEKITSDHNLLAWLERVVVWCRSGR